MTEKAVWHLFHRNQKWFGPEETTMVPLPTEGGVQDVRLFSMLGAALLATLTRQPQAIPFKKWLMRRALKRETPALPDGRPARAGHVLSLEQAKLLDFLAPYAEPGSKIEAVIKGVRSGALLPGDDPAVAALAARYQGAGALIAEARRAFDKINAEARELGYEPEAVRRAAKAMRLREQYPQLAFGEALNA